MRALVTVLMVAAAMTGYACDADHATPTSPTSRDVATPAPRAGPAPQVPGELWKLATTVVALDGSACFWSAPVGKTFDWTLSVERTGSDVRFVYDVNNVHDNLSFVGTVSNGVFAAASETFSSSWACAPRVTLSSSVTGSFSGDGRALSGTERLTYRVGDGEGLTITLEWRATRM